MVCRILNVRGYVLDLKSNILVFQRFVLLP